MRGVHHEDHAPRTHGEFERGAVVAVSPVKVSGNHATAVMQPQGRRSSTASLVKEGGVWRIAADEGVGEIQPTTTPPKVLTITTP